MLCFLTTKSSASTTNKYSISAVGAGSNVNVHVPFPLSTATGPPFGSVPPWTCHTYDVALLHTVVVTVNGYEHEPSSMLH